MAVQTIADHPMGYAAGAYRAFSMHMVTYRRSWHGSVFSVFLMPILYMVGIGLGVGQFVDPASLGGVEYAAFIAPGIIAMVPVNLAANDFIYPVFGGYREWGSQYLSQRASPLRPIDILNGHLAYGVLFRASFACAVVFVPLLFFDVFTSWWAPAAVPVGVLVSFAVAPWVFTWCSAVEGEYILNVIFRFAIMPVTLFSGVFFPITQMPPFVQPLAWISPLWHGVELTRLAATGTEAALPPALHALYLAALGVGGWFCARHIVHKRLEF
ncbi:ABC transporter permease [Salininema proteolyticum]|uniref:ABC transporter permease n=1 Tax=Salininema proteolyticum TaxID=1607685 RepID=A0ABV8TSJ1_9ACTN